MGKTHMAAKEYGCAVLAGGAGTRMGGTNKARLEYSGRSFMERICSEMKMISDRCYLSSANYVQDISEGWKPVSDVITSPDGKYVGPMGGIYSCLLEADKDGLDGLYFAPCDAPLYTHSIHERMAGHITDDTDAILWRTSDGRIQTTFGWYSAACIDAIREDLESGKYKILMTLDKVRCRVISSEAEGIDDALFMNINSESDYRALKGKEARYE